MPSSQSRLIASVGPTWHSAGMSPFPSRQLPELSGGQGEIGRVGNVLSGVDVAAHAVLAGEPVRPGVMAQPRVRGTELIMYVTKFATLADRPDDRALWGQVAR
jgi:hypothetical protein